MTEAVKDHYEAGHGAGIRVQSARHYVRKHEQNRATLPPPGNDYADEQRRAREEKMSQAIMIQFQIRRLPGEGLKW